MRRSQAERYARWSAATALLLAVITAGVYLHRGWVRMRSRRDAPPPPPQDVSRQEMGLTFSKVEQNRTIFTVQASKSTDFKGTDATLIEDVKITIFGATGQRHDIIHTRSCQYAKATGKIVCSGEVQFDLQSAADAQRAKENPAALDSQAIHVETRAVTFDRASGTAHTAKPVTFVFPNGTGEALGVDYDSEQETVRLLKNVRLTLSQPAPGDALRRAGKTAPLGDVQITGSSLEFGRDSRTMRLAGPAEAFTSSARLKAGEFSLILDDSFRPQTLVATSGSARIRPELTSRLGLADTVLTADNFTARFAPQGWVEKLEASGSVHGSRDASAGRDEFSSESALLDLWPRANQPRELELHGDVSLRTRSASSADSRLLQTNALRMQFSAGPDGSRSKLQEAETLVPGTLEWTDAAGQPGSPPLHTKLSADQLVMAFGDDGKARQLQAIGNVRLQREVPGHPVQTATAQTGSARMLPAGGWSQMDLQGHVELHEGDRSAQADHALFLRSAQTATLTGNATVRDPSTQTQAARITFAETAGDIRAQGAVRSTDFSTNNSVIDLSPAPANITADNLQANSKSGRALYTGHARFWQGESVLEADSIELLRDSRTLTASGDVRAVFPQTLPAAKPSLAQIAAKRPNLWHVSAGLLVYREQDSRAHLEKNVVVQSADQRMTAASLDLYFTRSGPNAPSSSPSSSTRGGAQQISRAAGFGGVTVEQGVRRATAERCEYTAADGKFVMSGGTPTIFDGSNGSTSGRQLTFFLADDTIIVDSENGSRTLTKHRVEN